MQCLCSRPACLLVRSPEKEPATWGTALGAFDCTSGLDENGSQLVSAAERTSEIESGFELSAKSWRRIRRPARCHVLVFQCELFGDFFCYLSIFIHVAMSWGDQEISNLLTC
ncbi:uncharacterized protein J3R85_014546 [Psidium guajava]|nr:uncharacterized protein J3R85_014546 [Psidium guajava]